MLTGEAVACSVLHDKAQVVVRKQHFLRLDDVHMPLAQFSLDLHSQRRCKRQHACAPGCEPL